MLVIVATVVSVDDCDDDDDDDDKIFVFEVTDTPRERLYFMRKSFSDYFNIKKKKIFFPSLFHFSLLCN